MTFNVNDFLLTFMSIIFEAMPFIVFGSIISGALEELLPQQFFHRWLPKNRTLAIVGSSLLGFILPMCECGIVPVMRRLLAKGVPTSCAVTYMLSAPVINPIVLWSTGLAFWGTMDLWGIGGLQMVLLRAGSAFLVAVTIGLLFERMSKQGIELTRLNVKRTRLVETEESSRLLAESQVETPVKVGSLPVLSGAHVGHHHAPGEACDHDHHHDHAHHHHDDHDHHHHEHHEHPAKPRSLLDRLSAVAEIALGDFLDILAFLVIGAALAATVRTLLSTERLDEISQFRVISVVGMMGLAYVLSLCSEADAFVAANFSSFSVGSKLAFLVLGPMLDIKLTIMYQWVFTPRAVRTIILTLCVLILVIGSLVEFLFPFLGRLS